MITKKIVVGNISNETKEKLQAFLERSDFIVEWLPSTRAMDALVSRVPFDMLIMGVPVKDMEIADLFAHIRERNMPCRSSPVILVGSEETLLTHERYIGRGATCLLPDHSDTETMEAAIAPLLHVAPRVSTRVMIRMKVSIEGREGQLLCQCDNLSMTGMLVRTSMRYEPGMRAKFEFKLPGCKNPITGEAEIVRHTIRAREEATGMGMRFVAFEGTGEQDLFRYLNQG